MTRLISPNRRRLSGAPSVLVRATVLVVAGVVGAGFVGACGWGASRPDPVAAESGDVVRLRDLPFAELSIPDQSRPDGATPPAVVPVDGPWSYQGATRGGMYKYSTPAPIRPRGLFFFQPPRGMSLAAPDGADVPYDRYGKHDAPRWSIDRESVYVYMPTRTPPRGDWGLSYPRAREREGELNFVFQTRTTQRDEFVWQSIQDDTDHRRGLLLPAPGTAAWTLTVPAAGELTFESGLVEPEVREGKASDGARLLVEVEADGETTREGSFALKTRAFTPRRIDLSSYAGREITLRMSTDPGGNADFDYAFVAEPVVASRLEDPVRVLMVFVDTLRPDHLSLYGYSRDTSASIDHLAQTAVIFEEARSVAPWTLPSARTIVTGRQPERYLAPETRTLPGLLGDAGFATGFIAGNVYLSVNFEMHRDWDLHRVGLWPSAAKITDDALAWLEAHEGRDAVLQVHYMDAHLPYLEPLSYRPMYAGAGPAGLRTTFHLSDVRRANLGGDPAGQQYIRDRYDNNVRYATDQIARLVEELDDNDILLLYSDHGEEFWEHDDFEHGHSLFDEVLRVPLVIRAPGVNARRVDAPVSLLDLTPTILDLVGQPIPDTVEGRSLVGVLRGEDGAEAALAARDQGFGRPLYGMEHWGVLHGRTKWITTEGREALYDLDADPGEQNNLLREPADDAGAAYRGYLAEAFGRPVRAGYRITPTRARTKAGDGVFPTWGLCTVEGGLQAAWVGNDPLEFGLADVKSIEDPAVVAEKLEAYQILDHELPETVGRAYELCWTSGKPGTREIYLVPEGPLDEVGKTLACSLYQGDDRAGRRATLKVNPRRATLDAVRTPIARVHLQQRQVMLQYGISPLPAEGFFDTDGTDDELSSSLTEAGYLQDDYRGPIGDCVPPKVTLPVPSRFRKGAPDKGAPDEDSPGD